MRSYVQVLTTPTADTPGTTLLLHFDNKNYLIGRLAEGTQRACVQMGARLLKVSECFLTGRTEWENTGGLLGMILTLADSNASSRASALEDALTKVRVRAKKLGVLDDPERVRQLEEEATKELKNNSLTLFGPPNLNHTLATARRFVFRKGMPVDVHEIHGERRTKEGEDEWAPYWADSNIKVWAMSITPDISRLGADTNGVGVGRPRKRSIDEVNGQEANGKGNPSESLTPRERDQLTVKAVVSEMFNSSWRLDTLYETDLANVNMPATIFIRNRETNKVERYYGPLPGGETPLPDPHMKVLVRRPWPGALVDSLPHTSPAPEAVSYIIRNHLQRGKFRPESAKALKVEQGPKWAKLTSGISVQNAEGETITPEMVLGESKDGGGLAVVDLPDSTYIDNLIRRPEWTEPKVMAGVGAIFWTCGKGVAADPRVQEFMRKHSNLQHIVSSPDHCINHIALDSSAAATIRLRRVDPARYGIPVHEDGPLKRSNGSANGPSALVEGAEVAARGQIIQLEPAFSIQTAFIVPALSITDVQNEMSPEVLDEAAKAQEIIKSQLDGETSHVDLTPNKDSEIITLGTGSALPSKYRNVSATLLRVPGWGSVLFDCGENTLGQLRRVFPPEELKQVFQELRIIWISHMHADHHLGTASVIKAWYQEVHGSHPAPTQSTHTPSPDLLNGQRRLAVISEPAMLNWLSEYASVEDYGFSRLAPIHISPALRPRSSDQHSKLGLFTPPSDFFGLSPQQRTDLHTSLALSPSDLGLQDIQAVSVQHCHGARAVSLTFPDGFKASYSGDCRPSKTFAQIGKGSTVCIHEATFDDELQGDAEAKNHSTTSEALGVAQAMGAKTCILTHFSQRYQKIPVLERRNGDGRDDGSVQAPVEVAVAAEEDSTMTNPEDDDNGPLEEASITFPDQSTGTATGQQYDIASKRGKNARSSSERASDSGPAAVKLRLESDMKVGVAFDYMRVKVGEIGQLEKFTPALLKLFAEEDKQDGAVAGSQAAKEGKGSKKSKKGR